MLYNTLHETSWMLHIFPSLAHDTIIWSGVLCMLWSNWAAGEPLKSIWPTLRGATWLSLSPIQTGSHGNLQLWTLLHCSCPRWSLRERFQDGCPGGIWALRKCYTWAYEKIKRPRNGRHIWWKWTGSGTLCHLQDVIWIPECSAFKASDQVGTLRVIASWFSPMWKWDSCSFQKSGNQKYLSVSTSIIFVQVKTERRHVSRRGRVSGDRPSLGYDAFSTPTKRLFNLPGYQEIKFERSLKPMISWSHAMEQWSVLFSHLSESIMDLPIKHQIMIPQSQGSIIKGQRL